MRYSKIDLSKTHVIRRAIILEIVGFLFLILTSWVMEYYDPPFFLAQPIVETIIIIIVGGITVHFTRKFIERIKYLEGFMIICASCKRVKEADGKWVTIEEIIAHKSDLQLTHGICPECAQKLYGEYL
jgi:hypothetical protein